MYRILNLDSRNQIQLEGMGSKVKSWYLIPEENASHWLFKHPQRENSGEHWAEKIAAEVAGFLGIPHARVDLAELEGKRGSATETIVPEHCALIHGNEVLESISFPDTADELNFHSSDHTLENIWLALDRTFGSDSACVEAKARFAEYLVLDAVIGNTDRHSENWGILQKQDSPLSIESLAPSYDHGSSLGHELMDERRERLLAENRVGDYVERGRGEIYWNRADGHGPSPLELVRLAILKYPEPLRAAIGKSESLSESSLRHMVNSIPEDWMTAIAKEFALELMRYSCGQLREAI